ncbi:MAG: glutaminyl-peptide cyclotransferase [Candidatus Sulfotelmatobacter sp.]
MSLQIEIFRRGRRVAVVAGFSLAVAAAFAMSGVSATSKLFAVPQKTEQSIPVLNAKILKSYPHDSHAFTQGLEYSDGFLYESTGETGQSSVRKVDLETGKVLQKVELKAEYFGEGLTIFRGKIYQLTWLSKIGFVYDLKTLRKLRDFHFYGEGWGLAHDGSNLILSDGTNTLRFLDPETFAVTRTLEVYAGKEAVTNLNELECIGNDIYSNVWHKNRIARIDERTGQVREWIVLSALAAQEQKEPEGVLNGIAFDPARHRFFVTGKDWAHLFEIQIDGITF